jgi:hypothetical protein
MDRCPICWEAMTHKNSYCTGICKHTFHGHCLLKWVCFKDPQGPHQLNCCTRRILRAPCPMCRRVLTLHSKHLRQYRYPYVHKKTAQTSSLHKRFMRFFCCAQSIVSTDET